jgi:hypothetical protein
MRNRLAITLVLALLVASCGDDDGSAVTTTTLAAATTTVASTVSSTLAETTTTTVTPAPDWVRIPGDVAIFGGPGDDAIAGVVAGGPGLVAVGSDYEGGSGSDGGEISDGDAAVWTSPDGVAWTRVPHDEAVFGGPDYQEMQGVVVLGSNIIAVGVDASGGDADAAVWTSSDGVNWNRVVAGESALGGPGGQAMLRVAAGGPGLVAVGFDDATGEFDWDAAVWTSPDGVTWTRVPHDEALFGGDRNQVMLGVVTADVGLVAIGWDRSGEDVDAAVWTSPDGLTWTRVPHDEAVFGGPRNQRMVGVVGGDAGVVVVGFDESGDDSDAAVWTSPDGVTWVRVVNPEAVLGGAGNQRMSGVVAAGGGLVAVGSDDSAGDSDAAAWTSPDGLNWTRVVDLDGAFGGTGGQNMARVVAGGPGLVGVGSDSAAGNLDAAVWTLTLG